MKPNLSGKKLQLGDLVRDSITGFEGVMIARTEWLNGCVRVSIQPKKLHDSKPVEAQVFDVEQVELVEVAPERAVAATGGERENVSRAPDPSR